MDTVFEKYSRDVHGVTAMTFSLLSGVWQSIWPAELISTGILGSIPPDRAQQTREQILGSCQVMLRSAWKIVLQLCYRFQLIGIDSTLHISENAQDFIAECLDMQQTADKAAKHPWLVAATPQLKRTPNGSRTASRSSSRISGRRERRFDARRTCKYPNEHD